MDLVLSVLIVIAVQLVMFLILRGRIHQELNATTLLKDVQDEVDGMVRELNLSAERNIGVLEARIEELEGLLALADQKVVLLAREIERKEKSAEVYTQLKRVAPVPTPVVEPEAEAEDPGAPVVASGTEDRAPEPAAVEAEVEPVIEWKPSAPAGPAGGLEPLRPRSLKDRVLALRDQDLAPAAIASATGATQGEVELILSLNPRG